MSEHHPHGIGQRQGGLASGLRRGVEPALRRGLHLYWRFSRGLTLGVRGAAIDGDGRVCLVRHTYVPGWHLPGGGVEPGETAAEALRRELSEEAGVALGAAPPRLLGVYLNTSASNRDHVLVYVAEDFRLSPKVPDREIAEARFFPLEAPPEGTTAATRRRLAEVRAGGPPSPTW